MQFRTASTVHSIALDAAGLTLAVGTSEHTEIYHIRRGDRDLAGREIDFPPERPRPLPVSRAINVSVCFVKARLIRLPLHSAVTLRY